MKFFCEVVVGLTVLLSLFVTGPATANDNGQPLSFGSSVYASASTFQWVSASDDGVYRYDIYTNIDLTFEGSSITVTTLLDVDSLALVSGWDVLGSIDGYLDHGVYHDSHAAFDEDGDWTIQEIHFSHRSGSSYDRADLLSGLILTSGNADYTETTASGQAAYSTVWHEDGTSTWIMNTVSDIDGVTGYFGGQVSLFGLAYEAASGHYHCTAMIGGDDSGPQISESRVEATDYFSSYNGGFMTLAYVNDNGIGEHGGTVNGSDPAYGALSGSFTSFFESLDMVQWAPRAGPTFAAGHLWIKQATDDEYRLLTWQGGILGSDGIVTDTYLAVGGLTVAIIGDFRSMVDSNIEAQVTVDGVACGTMSIPELFDTSGSVWEITTADPGTTAHEPFFTGTASLWVNGSEFLFDHGFLDSFGVRSDVYMHPSIGAVTITGQASDANSGSVVASGSQWYATGTYANGTFEVDGVSIFLHEPLGHGGFWIRGRFYSRLSAGANTFSSGAGSLSLSRIDGNTLSISGNDDTGPFSGTLDQDQAGVFAIQDDAEGGVLPVAVIPAEPGGVFRLTAMPPPAGLPPAVLVEGHVWLFLGLAPDDSSTANINAAYYGSSSPPSGGVGLRLLKIQTGQAPLATVTYSSHPATVDRNGSYSLTTHLFQSHLAPHDFPAPVYAICGACENHQRWDLPAPPSGSGLPPTLLVDGDVWRYAGLDESLHAVYQGYFTGQHLSLSPQSGGPGWKVILTDPLKGDTSGVLSGVRGTARLADGRLIYNGNDDGGADLPAPSPAGKLQTVAADLDILGNTISFGIMPDIPGLAGAVFELNFLQNNPVLKSTLATPQAAWEWDHARDASGTTSLPALRLDVFHRLTIYNVSTGAQGQPQPAIVLDPAPGGASAVRGKIRVRRGGNLSMGEFQHGGAP